MKTPSEQQPPRPVGPRWATRFLQWFCAPHLVDEMEGDLDELFQERVQQIGLKKARLRYIRDVVSLLRPFVIKRKPTDGLDRLHQQTKITAHHQRFGEYPHPSTLDPIMIRNYLKVAWRNLIRAKGYASINIAGLAVGMAASSLIFLWIQSELHYDRFYSKTDRLFQVYNRDKFSGTRQVWGTTPKPLAPALKQDYPDIEDVSRFRPTTFLLTATDKKLNISGAFVDPAFLNLFDFPFISGNRQTSLSGSNGIVITKSLSEKLFGTTDALGKVVQLDRKDSFSVTGILDDLPDNTQFSGISYLLPWAYFVTPAWDSDEWSSNNNYTYVLLKDKANPDVVNEKIKRVTAGHLKGVIDDVSNRQIFLHPASKWHLYSKQENGYLTEGKIVTVRLFGIIAGLILLIAAVNFVNLSTARSEKRAKEVGVRKVAGAQKSALIFQFISESMLLALLSGILALLLIVLCIPLFNDLTDKRLSLDLGTVDFWLMAVAFVLFTGLLAGSYPAFFLANFQPVKVIKGTYQSVNAIFSPRKGLVIAQFTFAIVLIIATLVIQHQLNYAQNRESGYNRNNLLFFYLTGDLPKHYGSLQQELLQSGAAISVSKSLGPITTINSRQWGLSWPGSTKTDKDIEFDRFGADEDFLKTTGTKLLAGREIDIRKYSTDSSAVLLNETAVKTMHLKNPVGTSIHFDDRDWQVIGVVKDFIFASPYESINPVIVNGPKGSVDLAWTSIRLNPANTTAKNLELVETVFKKYNSGYPFDYSFADESYKAKFADEQRTGLLTGLFTGLTIFISCLGLFGLAAYTAQQRTKEIGVRKVLGATVTNIVRLLTKDFIQLMGIAFVIGAPIGWFAMEKWLQDYTYRITIGVGIFIVTLVLALLLVVLTVSFQAIKAAVMNPVKSLRSE
ncbi:FtsX-like permease family protein [Spirosoma aureum]|uniref:FtsX-like permease family protein n=1 Tax=Spirosoma aureum TaxID=2692134 RepID=A0A6G9AQN0_9BACT|nr:ABC transporter permease [Spirosoma aureum]QIP14678.1 FtsX-like permease family protein [Spirosoma aureum]